MRKFWPQIILMISAAGMAAGCIFLLVTNADARKPADAFKQKAADERVALKKLQNKAENFPKDKEKLEQEIEDNLEKKSQAKEKTALLTEEHDALKAVLSDGKKQVSKKDVNVLIDAVNVLFEYAPAGDTEDKVKGYLSDQLDNTGEDSYEE